MTAPQPVNVPGQRDWTLDPGRRIRTLAWEFHPGTLRAGRWPDETTSRLYAETVGGSGEVAVGGIRRDLADGWEVAVAFLTDGNAVASARTRSMAVEALRAQLHAFAARGVRIATPSEFLGSDPFNRPVLMAAGLPHVPQPVPDAGVLARLDIPAPIEDWHALCDAWGVPRNPDALVRAIQAATWDRATVRHLADRRAKGDT